jgi:hypothetical protein
MQIERASIKVSSKFASQKFRYYDAKVQSTLKAAKFFSTEILVLFCILYAFAS